ncbi:MAG: exodeoxyribonuclease VII large subunit [Candidatus Sumerlaeaceae bacterium]
MTGSGSWDDVGPKQDALRVQPPSSAKTPLTVSQLAGQIRYLLEHEFSTVYVEGEVSGFKMAQSGHVYFSLKDEEAVIDCVIWRRHVPSVGELPQDGDHVEIEGALTTYPRGSRYQVVVHALRPAGLGRLYQRFIELKQRLEREGLFASERKRPLPAHPRTVGVITSPKGAAVRDVIKVLRRRAPQVRILIYPTRVQGEEAPAEIAHAIRRMNELAWADVLIVGRGGGSLEDLWAFNEEVVARAIAESKIPVISAVGHETDFTIADFVADERAPTPSAAAEIVAANSQELIRLVRASQQRLRNAMERRLLPLRRIRDLRARLVQVLRGRVRQLAEARFFRQRAAQALRKRLENFKRGAILQERLVGKIRTVVQRHRAALERFRILLALRKPLTHVNELQQQVDDHVARMRARMQLALASRRQRFELLSGKLEALDPKAVLSRGYSITFDAVTHQVVKSARRVRGGQMLRIVLHEGEIGAQALKRKIVEGSLQPELRPREDELPLDFGDSDLPR